MCWGFAINCKASLEPSLVDASAGGVGDGSDVTAKVVLVSVIPKPSHAHVSRSPNKFFIGFADGIKRVWLERVEVEVVIVAHGFHLLK